MCGELLGGPSWAHLSRRTVAAAATEAGLGAAARAVARAAVGCGRFVCVFLLVFLKDCRPVCAQRNGRRLAKAHALRHNTNLRAPGNDARCDLTSKKAVSRTNTTAHAHTLSLSLSLCRATLAAGWAAAARAGAGLGVEGCVFCFIRLID